MLRAFFSSLKKHVHLRNYTTKPLTIQDIAIGIKNKKYKKVITMLEKGAGVSVNAGIPDFRSEDGLFNQLRREFNIPSPEYIFDIQYNPDPFYKVSKKIYPTNFKPTKSHAFIKKLEDLGVLLRCYTQNIDGLERLAGVSEDLLVEAHGGYSSAHCIDCNEEYPIHYFKEHIFKDQRPLCTKCGGFVKPDIVFYGENLPARFYELTDLDFQECDLLFVMGTSLQVYPFAFLVNKVNRDVPRILINKERVGPWEMRSNSMDLMIEGDVDEGVAMIEEYFK